MAWGLANPASTGTSAHALAPRAPQPQHIANNGDRTQAPCGSADHGAEQDAGERIERARRNRDSEPIVVTLPISLSALTLDFSSPKAIYTQICAAIRTAITSGDLPPGTMMPTSREFAAALNVGRNTVVTAYTRLVAEGYLESKSRRGTRVVLRPLSARDIRSDRPNRPEGALEDAEADDLQISYAAARATSASLPNGADCSPFALHAIDPTLYPRVLLSRLLSEEFVRAPLTESGYGSGGDVQRFQSAIAAHIRQAHGVVCSPAQVIPTMDAGSAIDTVARLMIDAGNAVHIEDPSWELPRVAFANAGARVFSAPSDGGGVNPKLMAGPPARLVFVSPSVSFPLGAQMPAARRLELVEYARASNALLFEFDAWGELLFTGGRLRAIQSEAPNRTMYYGSLRKTLGPKIRVGYLVVPERFVEPLTKLLHLSVPHPHGFVLSALASFIESGHYALHVKKIRSLYAGRMAHLAELCRARIPEAVVMESGGGLSLALALPTSVPEQPVCRHAQERHMGVAPLSQFYAGQDRQNGVVLGIGNCPDRHLDALVQKLASCVREAAAEGASLGAYDGVAARRAN